MDGKATNSAPVACTLTLASQREEIKKFREELVPHVLERERLEDGARLIFSSAPGLRAKIERLVELDRGCCAFLNHQVESDGNLIALTIKSEGLGVSIAQEFLTVKAPTNGNWSTGLKVAAVATACGVACAAPFVLGALGLGAMGIGLGRMGIEIAALGMIVLAAAGFWYFKKKRVHVTEGNNNENRCGC